MVDHSVRRMTSDLIEEIKQSLKSINNGWGSVEIFVQDFKVTQITARNIRKTSHSLKSLEP